MEELLIRGRGGAQIELDDFGEVKITLEKTVLRIEFNGSGMIRLHYSGANVGVGGFESFGLESGSENVPSVRYGCDGATLALLPGTVMPDDTIYAGVSPDTGKDFFVAAHDTRETLDWDQASDYARRSTDHGHHDWRLPTRKELDVLFNNRAAIGGFNKTGHPIDGYYWSSTEGVEDREDGFTKIVQDERFAQGQRFTEGAQCDLRKDLAHSVRLVRG